MITPGTFGIAAKFQVSETAAILPLSLFVLGLALGPVLAAPISETKGRAIVYRVSIPLYMLFIIGAGSSETFGGLLVCRFLAGAFGAPCLAVAAGTVADLYEPHRMLTPGTIIVMAPFLGPGKHETRCHTCIFWHANMIYLQPSGRLLVALLPFTKTTSGPSGAQSSWPSPLTR